MKHLLIGSLNANSGKSATILGLAQPLTQQGLTLAYGKPLGTMVANASDASTDVVDADVRFITQTLGLATHQVRPTLVWLNAEQLKHQLQAHALEAYTAKLAEEYAQLPDCDLVILEGPSSLYEGRLFGLSLLEISETADADILLVTRGHSPALVEALMDAQQRLGHRLLGVLVADILPDQEGLFASVIQPFLEQQGIPVLGLMPRNALLRSVSVAELALQLKADVLCRQDRLNLMVEELTIGAMNVNSALKYFHKARNMAVVTGSDRTDLQLAALESSTQCLILTGRFAPNPIVLARAEDLEIPVLLVDSDTLTTVEIVDQAFGQVRLHETVKVECIQQMFVEHFDFERLLTLLGLKAAVV